MAKLTTHVLNLAAGIPAGGLRIDLHVVNGESRTLTASVITSPDGRCPTPLLEGEAFRAGRYSLTFHVAAYFRSLGVDVAEPAFLDEVVIAFGVAEPGQNYHVPLLVSPWSYSTYRGS
jgi:5-hydroxyisourate hydrolase